MALGKFLILRRPPLRDAACGGSSGQGGRLEGRTVPIRQIINFLTASSAGVTKAPSTEGERDGEIVGTGDYKYRIIENWAKLPDGWSFKEVAAVGVDKNDNVYAFNRGEHPMMVFDRDGNFLRSWGEGQYPRAHGVHMGPDDSIYLTDDGGHFVRKCSLDGKVLLEIGVPGKPAPYMSGEPFHRCTHTALSPKGDIYVSDGYGNARVHKYSPDGKLLMSWGEPGTDPGQFNIVHNICTDADGWVYVADRENHRVQVFDGNGKYETQWNNLHRPCGLYMDYTAATRSAISANSGRSMGVNSNSPNLRAAGQHRRQPGQAVGAVRRPACRPGADRVHRAARPCRRFARRPLCRRGLLDVVAGRLPGRAEAGESALLPQIRESPLIEPRCEGTRWARLRCRSTAARLRSPATTGRRRAFGALPNMSTPRSASLSPSVGQVGEARLLLLAALAIADELSDANDALQQERSRARPRRNRVKRGARNRPGRSSLLHRVCRHPSFALRGGAGRRVRPHVTPGPIPTSWGPSLSKSWLRHMVTHLLRRATEELHADGRIGSTPQPRFLPTVPAPSFVQER